MEELEETLTEVRARVTELESEVVAVTQRAAEEIEARTSGAGNKVRWFLAHRAAQVLGWTYSSQVFSDPILDFQCFFTERLEA